MQESCLIKHYCNHGTSFAFSSIVLHKASLDCSLLWEWGYTYAPCRLWLHGFASHEHMLTWWCSTSLNNFGMYLFLSFEISFRWSSWRTHTNSLRFGLAEMNHGVRLGMYLCLESEPTTATTEFCHILTHLSADWHQRRTHTITGGVFEAKQRNNFGHALTHPLGRRSWTWTEQL